MNVVSIHVIVETMLTVLYQIITQYAHANLDILEMHSLVASK